MFDLLPVLSFSYLRRFQDAKDSKGGGVQVRGERDIMERRERPLLPDQRPGMRARSQLPRHGVDDNSPGEAQGKI